MPSTSPVVITVDAVQYTFSPESVTGTHVQFVDRVPAALDEQAILHVDRPAANKETVRRSFRLNQPLVRTVDNVKTVKQASAKTEFVFPTDSTEAERDLVVQKHIEALKLQYLQSVATVPEWFW